MLSTPVRVGALSRKPYPEDISNKRLPTALWGLKKTRLERRRQRGAPKQIYTGTWNGAVYKQYIEICRNPTTTRKHLKHRVKVHLPLRRARQDAPSLRLCYATGMSSLLSPLHNSFHHLNSRAVSLFLHMYFRSRKPFAAAIMDVHDIKKDVKLPFLGG